MAAKARPGSRTPTGRGKESTQFRPGQSGNPSGRPKDLLTQAVRGLMTEDDARVIAQTVIAGAKNGDTKMLEMLWNRLEGKAVDRQERGTVGAFDSQVIETLDTLPSDQLRNMVKVLKPTG